MNRLGERIRSRRKEFDWTLADLAEETGLSRSYLSELENGKRSVGAETLQKIGEALDLSLDYLMASEPAAVLTRPATLSKALVDFGRSRDLPFGVVILLLGLHRVIATREKFRDPETFDWLKLYEAIKPFL